MLAVDSETTGLDFRHGAKPFFVTLCDESLSPTFFQWDVDPFTRQPEIPEEDIDELGELLSPNNTGRLVLQNSKFDVKALATIHQPFGDYWRWEDTDDTLIAGHLLASNKPHNLTDMAIMWLGINIQPYEDAISAACNEARRLCRTRDFVEDFGEWALAKEGRLDMPSAGEKCHKFDMWLPRCIAQRLGFHKSHPWWTVLEEYSNADSVVTVQLIQAQLDMIKKRGLKKLYYERLKVLPVMYKMEQTGVTVNESNLKKMIEKYGGEAEAAGVKCVSIAADMGFDLEMPNGASPNDSLREFFFSKTRATCPECGFEKKLKEWVGEQLESPLCPKCEKKGKESVFKVVNEKFLDLPRYKGKKAKTNAPTLDKTAMDNYLVLLETEGGVRYDFIKTLMAKRSRDTALAYMHSYGEERFGVRFAKDWLRVFSSINPTGTDTLRCSSENPNSQNISKKSEVNVRYCFGPGPGREWWSLDGKNLELRLPAYEANEPLMVDLFERPNDPPYFGSYHLLVFDILHPDKFAKDGKKCKDIYESTWYQWTKNGNFAVQYGAQESSGTADAAYHVHGAQHRIQERFTEITKLSKRMINHARQYGYVETIPDRSVDPKRGYPLLCTRTEQGYILPTVPLSYHIQGSACWWMMKGMIRCQAQLDEWNNDPRRPFDGNIAIQVHDELVFDFPKAADPRKNPKGSNLWRIRKMQQLMEMSGQVDFNIPTPVDVEYNPITWAEGFRV